MSPTSHRSVDRFGRWRLLGLRAALLSTLLVCTAAARAQSPAAASGIDIPYERYTLTNGMTVVLAEDHATPTVAVVVSYHVGSRDEEPGRTGFAHLFEHVMFTGSGHAPYGTHSRYTNDVGGEGNGTTNNDRTLYYDVTPSNYLQHVLWLESDRMGWLLDALDSAKLNAQRDVVRNERRGLIDNQPYGRAEDTVSLALYPPGHPYSWSVIGSMADLGAASVDDVKRFFRRWYVPNNAVLVIAGDFRPAQAREWVRTYFADVPRGASVSHAPAPPAALAGPRPVTIRSDVQVPRLYVSWSTPGVHGADRYALALANRILTGGRTARLTRALVYERQQAASVFSYFDPHESAGELAVIVSPRAGHTVGELAVTIDSVLARLRAEGPTAEEVQRAKAAAEMELLKGLQNPEQRAIELAEGEMFFHDPSRFRTDWLRTRAVTAADVRQAARRWLGPGHLVLRVVPNGG